jgi:hypothetical protein
MEQAVADTAVTETIYRTQHFEAKPYLSGKYVLVHRDSNDRFASGREIPAEHARMIVEILEQGFHIGATTMANTMRNQPQAVLRELCGPMGVPEVVTQPITK